MTRFLGIPKSSLPILLAIVIAALALSTRDVRPALGGGAGAGSTTVFQLGTPTKTSDHVSSLNTILDWSATGQGGYVDEKFQGDSRCPAGYDQFRFSWTFLQDVTTLTAGETLTATVKIERTNNGPSPSCWTIHNTFMYMSGDGDTIFVAPGDETTERYFYQPWSAGPTTTAQQGPRTITVGSLPHAGYVPSLQIFISGFADVWGQNLYITYPYAAGTGSGAPAPAPSRAPAPAATLLGGMDLNGYCQSQGYLGVTLTGQTINDWGCITSINVNAVCQQQYQAGAVGEYTNFNDPNSWRCYAPTAFTGPHEGADTGPHKSFAMSEGRRYGLA